MTHIEIPQAIMDTMQDLNALCDKYPKSVPVDECARLVDMHKDVLRESIDQGRCPFGFGTNGGKNGRRFAKIPTIKLYNWLTNNALFDK